MATEHILRLERSDSPDDFVLINVSRSGKSELDLKFVATEGENPYVGSLKTSQISKLRAKNYRGSDEEWSGVLSYVFNQDRDAIKSEDWTTGLEVVATVKLVGDADDDDDDESDKEIIITLRKRIDSITQRLGSITLKQDDDQAIQLFDWTGVSVTRANDLAQEIFSLNAKYRDAERKINQLNSQLEELIQAKKEHDDQLIAKFALLLNEKKLKIRNQQRLLATAKVDPAKLAELEAANAGKKPRKPNASRHSKRKVQAEEEEETDSDDAFDTMDIDPKENATAGNNQTKRLEDADEEDIETATESERASTPQPLEDEETASEEDDPVPVPPKRGKQRAAAAEKQPEKPPGPSAARKPTASPPPRRELPFARRGGTVKSAPAFKPKIDENEIETESDEDL